MSRGPMFELSRRAASKAVLGGFIVTLACMLALASRAGFFSRWWAGEASFTNAGVVVWLFTAGLAFGLFLLGFAASSWLAPRRGQLFLLLQRYGDPVTLAGEIDAELTELGLDGRARTVLVTRSWIVGILMPGVFRLADLAAVGVGPGARGITRVVCWERGRAESHTFEVWKEEGAAVLERLRQVVPELVVSDVATFEARWKADRLVIEAAALARGTTRQSPAA